MSLKAYQQAQKTTASPRESEYRLFANVTRALMEVAEGSASKRDIIAAVDWNRRLWSTLAQDCAQPDNKLPETTRASIVSIGIWVTKYSGQVTREGADIRPLIDVNRTIMDGLKPGRGASAEPALGASAGTDLRG